MSVISPPPPAEGGLTDAEAPRVVVAARARRLGRWPKVSVWTPVLLLLAAGVTLPVSLAISQANWVEHMTLLPWVGAGGLALGFILGRSRFLGMLAHLVALAAGCEVVVLLYGAYVGSGAMSQRITDLVSRVVQWAMTVAVGEASGDPLLFALAMAGLVWWLGYMTGWLIFRGQTPFLAAGSNGVALLIVLSYTSAGETRDLLLYLCAACFLLAVHQVSQREQLWRRAQLGVESRVGARLLAGTLVLALALIGVAWLLPVGSPNPQVAAAWNQLSQPWQDMEASFDRAFAALNGTEAATRGLNFGSTLAPRGSFDLGTTPVLSVTSPQPLYWRATTLDEYTGRSMVGTAVTTRQTPADGDLQDGTPEPADRADLTVDVTVLATRAAVLFVPDMPLTVSVPSELEARGSPQDVSTLRPLDVIPQGQTYTLTAAVSDASVQDLRAAGQQYPDWVQQKYLQLPGSLPSQVRALAHEVVGQAIDPYDQAAAVETYLRNNYTYSTHVTVPPADQDWVDYFLFDSKEGYCDYFATAMVVMLRTQGIPARVASGFAPGDEDSPGQWTVRENHAHSWVEAYFPGYGWQTFEPSAIRALPDRPDNPPVAPTPSANNAPAPVSQPTLTPDEQREAQQLSGQGSLSGNPWAVLVLALEILAGLLVIAAATGLAIRWLWLRGLATLPWYQRPYAQLVRLAAWVGAVHVRPAQTPYEVAEMLRREVRGPAGATITTLADAYVEGTYGSRAPSGDPLGTWVALRRSLARGLLARRLRALLRR